MCMHLHDHLTHTATPVRVAPRSTRRPPAAILLPWRCKGRKMANEEGTRGRSRSASPAGARVSIEGLHSCGRCTRTRRQRVPQLTIAGRANGSEDFRKVVLHQRDCVNPVSVSRCSRLRWSCTFTTPLRTVTALLPFCCNCGPRTGSSGDFVVQKISVPLVWFSFLGSCCFFFLFLVY